MLSLDILVQPGTRSLPRPLYASPDPSASSTGTARPMRILLVEDDFIVAGELEQCLLDAGFDVIGPASSAEEAVRLALEFKPALVVMDIRLVGPRDGIEAAIDIYRQAGIRSIFATAHSDLHTMKRGEAANPLDWVQKPYNPLSLVRQIRIMVGAA